MDSVGRAHSVHGCRRLRGVLRGKKGIKRRTSKRSSRLFLLDLFHQASHHASKHHFQARPQCSPLPPFSRSASSYGDNCEGSGVCTFGLISPSCNNAISAIDSTASFTGPKEFSDGDCYLKYATPGALRPSSPSLPSFPLPVSHSHGLYRDPAPVDIRRHEPRAPRLWPTDQKHRMGHPQRMLGRLRILRNWKLRRLPCYYQLPLLGCLFTHPLFHDGEGTKRKNPCERLALSPSPSPFFRFFAARSFPSSYPRIFVSSHTRKLVKPSYVSLRFSQRRINE